MSESLTRCVQCDASFTSAELVAMPITGGCPSCGTESLPVGTDADVTVKINWHELRILGIGAENWAERIEGEGGVSARMTLKAIVRRLQTQYPERPPLTLSGEVEALKAAGHTVELVRSIGAFSPPK